MCKELSENEHENMKRVGQVISKYAMRYSDGIVENYQLATLLLSVYRFNLITSPEFAKFKYDLDSNHVIVTEVSTDILNDWNLTEDEDNTYQFYKSANGLKDRLGRLMSGFTWPQQLKRLLHLCFETSELFSIMNFILGCHYWDAYDMYHLIIGRKIYPLTEDILFNSAVKPVCYLPDVPDSPEDIEEYLDLFRKVREYLPEVTEEDNILKIETPLLTGLITKEMWELSDKILEASDIGCYRCSCGIRRCYTNLDSLTKGIPLMRSSFYDFGVIV